MAILTLRWRKMKNKALMLLTSAALAVGAGMPALADDGPVHSMAQLAGASTALVVDVPEGMVVDGLYRVPKKCWKSLAYHLGDNHDQGICWLGQQMVGMTVGVPVGVLWGIPYGALHGAKHGIGSGWDKPFSSESYIVTEEK